MTSSLRHKTKFWGLFLQIPKVQLNIYRMVVWNKLYLERFRSYSHLKMSNFGRRERERESGTVTCHVSMFKCPGWKFVGNVYNLFCAFFGLCLSWWMFQWRSGALARAQISFQSHFTVLKPHGSQNHTGSKTTMVLKPQGF